MKKFKKFAVRKLKDFKEELIVILIAIPFILLTFAVMALPGVIVAFLVSGMNPEALAFGGCLSFIAISFIWMAIKKIQKLIKEYKFFNEDEDEEC